MTTEKNDTLEIVQVANGFIVRPSMGGWMRNDETNRQWAGSNTEYHVFRTFAELTKFLAQNFSHRGRVEDNDVEAMRQPLP